MADHQRDFLLFLVLFSCLVYSSCSYQFVVGGRDGWVVKPSENYNQWAGRMRFQVNDTLLFKYKSGSDSVVVVNKDDYDKCNAANPIIKLDDGNSIFKFNRSGPFYFISGNKSNCDQGQKLVVVVLAVRTPPSPSPPHVPSPTTSPPQGSSPSSSPAGPGPAASPFSPSPSSGAPAPATSPPSPSPASLAPAPAGTGPAPAGISPEPPSPSATPGSPSASTPGSPGSSTPGSGTPADANAPPSQPRSLAAPPCSSCVFLMSAVSLVLSVGLGVFV